MDDQVIADANNLLRTLADQAKTSPEWVKVMADTLSVERGETTLATVTKTIEKFQIDHEPIGAIAMGTGVLRDAAGLPGERGSLALNLLKTAGRVVQGGPGRGKCLVVVSEEPLEHAPEVIVEAPPNAEMDPLDLLDLLHSSMVRQRAIDAQMIEEMKQNQADPEELAKLKRWAEELLADKSTLTRQLDEANQQLRNKEEVITKLERQLAEKTISSWS